MASNNQNLNETRPRNGGRGVIGFLACNEEDLLPAQAWLDSREKGGGGGIALSPEVLWEEAALKSFFSPKLCAREEKVWNLPSIKQ